MFISDTTKNLELNFLIPKINESSSKHQHEQSDNFATHALF